MGRLRLTQVFPFLIPLRQKQRKYLFYKEMSQDGHKYANTLDTKLLKTKTFCASEEMVNENSGFPIEYQYNKVHNLKVAAKALNGLLIKPGETFSFWQILKDADKDESYKPGLILINDKMTEAPGGGLCQLSNLLYWVFLHSPLTRVERTAHDIEAFYLPEKLYGVDATVSEGWIDLKMKNETEDTYQLNIEFSEDDHIQIALLSDESHGFSYEIYNNNNEITNANGQLYRSVDIWRRTKNIHTNKTSEQYLYTDQVKIGYNIEEVQT